MIPISPSEIKEETAWKPFQRLTASIYTNDAVVLWYYLRKSSEINAGEMNRTLDKLITHQLLYLLSYSGKEYRDLNQDKSLQL